MGGMGHTACSRSRSPVARLRSRQSRSRSPIKHRVGRREDRKCDKTSKPLISLPFNQKPLLKDDLLYYRPMFSLYLDIQKQLSIDDLDENEVKGRWKSFIGKWNRAELAEGWYDPATLTKAQAQSTRTTSRQSSSPEQKRRRLSPTYDGKEAQGSDSEEEDNDSYGPSLPGRITKASAAVGPSRPTVNDLRERHDLDAEYAREEREALRSVHTAERKAERKLHQERLDEIAPRAEAGTRERHLEKKREKAASNKTFADARERSPEFRDDVLMGGGDGDLSDIKRMKKEESRKKNERELRREEILRARAAEREERMKGIRAKEERTLAMLKELAESRFGRGHA